MILFLVNGVCSDFSITAIIMDHTTNTRTPNKIQRYKQRANLFCFIMFATIIEAKVLTFVGRRLNMKFNVIK